MIIPLDMLRALLMRVLGGIAVVVLTIYGFRAAPVTVGIIDDQLRFVMPWLREAWISLACIAAASAVATLLVAQPIFARFYERRHLRIVFPNAVNLDSKQSLFRKSTTLFSSGPSIQGNRRIGTHRIFVGAENSSGSFTARNARLCALTIRPPGYAVDIAFAPTKGSDSKVDIQPGDTELFLVLVGNDEGRFTATPKIVSPEHFEQACAMLDGKPHERAFLANEKNAFTLLRNDGYVLELQAYADDARPARAIAVVNTRSRIELFLYRSRLHMRVAGYIERIKEKAYALLGHVGELSTSPKPKSSNN